MLPPRSTHISTGVQVQSTSTRYSLEMYTLRAQPHQNPVAPDFRIPAMLSKRMPRISGHFRPLGAEAGNPGHSHWKALQESRNPEPQDFGVAVP